MEKRAIEKAIGKFVIARKAHETICQSQDLREINLAWTDFILACGVIFSALEKGAKSNPKSTFWYGTKKHIRKTDPLLSYIRDARNAEEHGIDQITKVAAKSIVLKHQGSAVTLRSDGKNWNVERVSGPPFEWQEPKLVLQTVYDDRFNQKSDPPKSHLGIDLGDQEPKTVSALALTYVESLIREAATLVS